MKHGRYLFVATCWLLTSALSTALAAEKALAEPSAVRALDQALANAKGSDRLLFVKLGGPNCGPCISLDRFLKQPEAAAMFQNRLDVVSLDVRQKDHQKTLERLGKVPGGGIPQWWLVTPEGEVIGNSAFRGKNLGYPSSQEGGAHFVTMLQAGLRLNPEQGQKLRQLLRADNAKIKEAVEDRQKERAKKIRQERAKNVALPITTQDKSPTTHGDQTWTETDYFSGKQRLMTKQVRVDNETGKEFLTMYIIYSPSGMSSMVRVVKDGRMTNQFVGNPQDYFSIMEDQMAGPNNKRHDWVSVVEFGDDWPKEESYVSTFVVVDGLHLEPRPVEDHLKELDEVWEEHQASFK